jgi:hypothetical protein
MIAHRSRWFAIATTVVLVALLASACESAPPTPKPDTLYVDAEQRRGEISPYIYGTNYGPWITVPVDLIDAYEASGLRFLRFPGGHWGDVNDIRPSQFDWFIKLAEMIDAEPSVSVRLLDGTPEEAAALVEYANIEHDYDIRYWSIGNEPSLYATMDRAEEYDTAYFNARWRTFAEAMLAVDPDIQLLGPEVHQFRVAPEARPKDAEGRDWMREFLLANGDMVDLVTFHRYPFPKNPADAPPTIDDLRRNSQEWDELIPALRDLIAETTDRELPIGVTEVNSNWSSALGGEGTPDSFYNAIWWADVLGRLAEQQVEIVAHFALQSPASMGGWGMLARYEVRPTYYVYQLYQRFGETLIFTACDDPDLSIYGAVRDDGALTLMIVNLGPEPRDYPLHLAKGTPTGEAEVWRLDAEHNAEQIAPQTLSEETMLTLPAQSVTLYVIPSQSSK